MMLDIKSKEYETMIEEMKQGKKSVKTPWGTANKYKDRGNYYIITSVKEGFCHKRVHVLIWQEFYGKNVPKGYVIHHLDSNELNNAINNLQCAERSKHTSFHQKADKHWMYRHDLDDDEIFDLYVNQGKTEVEIAEILNTNQRTVDLRLINMGVDTKGKYNNWWDVSCVHYCKSDMLKDNGGNNPRKAFKVVYNGYNLPIGGFIDFVSPKIIGDLINEFIEEGEQ